MSNAYSCGLLTAAASCPSYATPTTTRSTAQTQVAMQALSQQTSATLVIRAGHAPYPLTIRQVVSMVQAGRVVPARCSRIDPANPATVLLGV